MATLTMKKSSTTMNGAIKRTRRGAQWWAASRDAKLPAGCGTGRMPGTLEMKEGSLLQATMPGHGPDGDYARRKSTVTCEVRMQSFVARRICCRRRWVGSLSCVAELRYSDGIAAARTMIALEADASALQRRLPDGWELAPYAGDDLRGTSLRGANMLAPFHDVYAGQDPRWRGNGPPAAELRRLHLAGS